jgi:capsule biosynthesis phosphatase
MYVVVLCGGSGTRMNDYSFPKPLNMIYGKPAIYYTLSRLPASISTIHFIVAPHLIKFNFAEIVTNLFKEKTCVFHYLPYFTRGAAESAMLGTRDFDNEDESIIFLDNDVIYDFPENFFKDTYESAFIGYAEDKTGSESYSFLTIGENDNILDYKEKVRISSLYCCGLYGFKSLKQFRELVETTLNDLTYSEAYLSTIFTKMLSSCIPVKGIKFDTSIHIGSLHEIKRDITKIPTRNMRICFDLDNTLVTYPTIPGDYSTVRPIKHMIDLLRKLKNDGHTIIIHTARRMATHKNNVGAVIKDIGALTFKTLEDFDIPYDEILFGKPIADIYIDDRAINPYRNDMLCMGLVDIEENDLPLNMLDNNTHNSIKLENNIVYKRGPSRFMRGESFYYNNIPRNSNILAYFPKYYGSTYIDNDNMEIKLEHIKGIPFYTLYKHNNLTINHIDRLFEFIDCLHNQVFTGSPSQTSIYNNYVKKLEKRFEIGSDYPFHNAKEIQEQCLSELKLLNYNESDIRNMIHGDLWFSNIIIDFNHKIKTIDMKGIVDTELTLGGDLYYDYGKLYQSFLGYDSILYNHSSNIEIKNKYMDIFIKNINKRNINIKKLKTITFSLIMGVFHSLKDISTKERVWNWIVNLRNIGHL